MKTLIIVDSGNQTELLEYNLPIEQIVKELKKLGWLIYICQSPCPFPSPDEESSSERIVGCQSTNHDHCYGELWQCAACGKTVCYAEGTDNRPELCDDCWVITYGYAKSESYQDGDCATF